MNQEPQLPEEDEQKTPAADVEAPSAPSQRPEPEVTSRRHDMFTALGCCVIFGVAGIFFLILANFLITAVLSFANAPRKTPAQNSQTSESVRP